MGGEDIVQALLVGGLAAVATSGWLTALRFRNAYRVAEELLMLIERQLGLYDALVTTAITVAGEETEGENNG